MSPRFRITGRHVLAALVGFFLVIIAVNAVFLHHALRTFPGEKEKKSYLQGLNYNDRLAARATQEALGWSATIEEARLTDDLARIEILFSTARGAPLNGLSVSATLSRPASDREDQAIAFKTLGGGLYEAIMAAGPGAWNLDGRAVNERGETFEFSSRLFLE